MVGPVRRRYQLSNNGFKIPSRLGDAIASNASSLALDANAVATYFKADGTARKAGETMTNVAYAKTLTALAEQGPSAMYTGQIAQDIVAKAKQSVGDDAAKTPITPSLMTMADLAAYKAKERDPVCTTYRNSYYVCSMSPPSSGGIAVTQALGILKLQPLQLRPHRPGQRRRHPVRDGCAPGVRSQRLAYADRDTYVADTDFVPLPAKGVTSMLDKNYLKSRAA